MRDHETSKYLKPMIKKLDQIRTETNNINVIRSYSPVVKNNTVAGRPTPRRIGTNNNMLQLLKTGSFSKRM